MLLKLSSSVLYYRAKIKPEDGPIQDMLSALAEAHRRWGFWKMYDYIRTQTTHLWNHKRVYRIYLAMCLNFRRKCKKRLPVREKETLTLPISANIVWSMDFMHDRLVTDRAFRTLNILDDYNREVLQICIDTSINAERVKRELTQLFAYRGKPAAIRMDNGPELAAIALWLQEQGIDPLYIQPGKPNQNAYIERFNRTFREDVLSQYLFTSLSQVRLFTSRFIREYNNIRPHDNLKGLTPRSFLLKYGKLSAAQADEKFPTFQQDDDDDNFLLSRVAN
jgi:putative transposase